MFNDYYNKIKKIKEDLIYAINEKYDGEYEIEDVTDSAYTKMLLNNDKTIIDESNKVFAEAAAKVMETIEQYTKDFSNYDGRTLFRNSEIVTETLDDLCRAVQIFTLSIRKNNANWQAKLFNILEEGNKENED